MKNCLKEIELVYNQTAILTESIHSSKDAERVLRSIYKSEKAQMDLKEYFYILLLNRANKVLGYHKLSSGGISGTVADIRLSFATALKSVSSALILAHNHPSSNTIPSDADKVLTKKFKEAGQLLDIQVLDHIILGSNGFYSFADEGII